MNMNTCPRFVAPALLVAAAVVLAGALPAAAQQMQPPAPEEPSSTLEYPKPIGPGEISPVPELPNVPLAFYLTVDRRPVLDDWNVVGVVTATGQDRVLISPQEGGEEAELRYRLPEGHRLELEPESPVQILRTAFLHGVSFGYGLDILSGERPAAAASRSAGDSPQEVNVLGGRLQVQQTGERVETLAQSDYDTTYAIGVQVVADRVSVSVGLGGSTEVVLTDGLYRVTVIDSSETVPGERFAGSHEGAPFTLEFVVTPLEVPIP